MGGAIHPLPQYAFMAWCSVKRSTAQLYLYSNFVVHVTKETNQKHETTRRKVVLLELPDVPDVRLLTRLLTSRCHRVSLLITECNVATFLVLNVSSVVRT
jgi:hypothetical protein